MYSFVRYPISLSPPPQWIRIFTSHFRARRLRQNQTLPSGGRESRVHSSTTCRASFAVRINALLTNLIQGGEIMWIPTRIFGSLSPAGKITAQEAATTVSFVLPSQRGLRHCTSRPILQNPYSSGGGASHVHGLTTHRSSVSISVSVSKYCCSFSFYCICFIMFFADPFVLMVYIFISYIFLLVWLLIFLLCLYYYSNHYFSWLFCSFNIIFWSSDYFFLLNSYYYIRSIYYFSSLIIRLK